MSVSAPSVWNGEKPLILASRSAARRDLLASCGIAAELVPADIDERSLEADDASRGALPALIARRLAAEKARVVSQGAPGRYVLGADQVLAFDDHCWAKPHDRRDAASRLMQLSSRSHRLISDCAVARDGALLYEGHDVVDLSMRALSREEIELYLDLVGEEALASVGSYRIEGLGRLLFERVEADQAAILGLPLSGLLRYFRACGLIRL
jgi:septum formation protein